MANQVPRGNRVPLVKKVKQGQGVILETWDYLAKRDLSVTLGNPA